MNSLTFVPFFRNELKEIGGVYSNFCFKIHNTEEAITENKKRLAQLAKQEAETKADFTSWEEKVNFKYLYGSK